VPKPINGSERMDYVFGHRSEPPTAWLWSVTSPLLDAYW
jgi:hypothetical protein